MAVMQELVRVTGVRCLHPYELRVEFSDGKSAVLDFSGLVRGPGLFAALADVPLFASVRVNDAGTLEWPGQLDLCPDVLYHVATGAPLPGGVQMDIDPGFRCIQPAASPAGV